MALCARTHARFLKTFVNLVLFGHNYGPQKQQNPHQNFVCRLGKCTSICAIDLAVQHIIYQIYIIGSVELFSARNNCLIVRERCMDLVSFESPEEFRHFAEMIFTGCLL